ncbi:pyrimidine 5'-nucleotidase [Caulobacter flavus]|uniref:Pyrimidine 5'-nucleotidase n=1 Tax=Caulobacter flavus TaxID=1679497 RepID=A0A2N5CQT8_9CAUL|nr:pyrimidine 5'-nucleotidase [Caulobacter flavus]AYV45545.1 pyrimidine 5'-nucleotidase [Caulobacter flavus]PLR10585.1 pyrimidine 5'-nucleotidase [Caulobacter flavus]
MAADLTHVDTWLFDLDNTLYPAETQFMALIEGRMTDFVERFTGLPREEARALQKKYYLEHGTTLAGLMTYHGMDPAQFLEEVHDVSMENLVPDTALHAAIDALPGRRLVFTNGSLGHAERVLGHLGLRDLFSEIFAIETADYIPKPSLATFDKITKLHAIDPPTTAFFEDSEKNLVPAARLGMTTVLVGAHAAASTSEHVHHRTNDLAGFLSSARLKGTST